VKQTHTCVYVCVCVCVRECVRCVCVCCTYVHRFPTFVVLVLHTNTHARMCIHKHTCTDVYRTDLTIGVPVQRLLWTRIMTTHHL
jgi:hypothetical protein